jgi:hypothetical protein
MHEVINALSADWFGGYFLGLAIGYILRWVTA